MKKAIYTVITLLLVSCFLISCEKEYHCACTFNNSVIYTRDLGNQYKNNAQKECSSYDSTVAGEVWNCSIY
jgi:hypothetical protein